jgi:hypothetical protein
MGILRRAIAASLLALAHGVLAQPACGPTGFSAGPSTSIMIDGVGRPSGFSGKVVDSNGVSLVSCLNGSGTPDGTAANPCAFFPVEPGNALSAALGQGLEAFWFLAENLFTTSGPASVNARIVMGLESTFTTPTVVDGAQTQFQRFRARINVNATGYYTLEHPWGSKTWQVTTLLSGDGLSKSEINETVDTPFSPGQAVAGQVAPFLMWDAAVAPAPPVGYLGDGFTPHAVLGSACGRNFVRLTAVALDNVTPITIDPTDADGDGRSDRYASPHFIVMGQEAPATLSATPRRLDFSAQSMGTTSPALAFTLANLSAAPVTVGAISITDPRFTLSTDCTMLPPGASCVLSIAFAPTVSAGPLLANVPVEAQLVVTSNGSDSPHLFGLSGTAEKSLVSHYYRSILRRAPDGGGRAFWDSEAARMQAVGVNVNEAWFSMAGYFYGGAEYLAFGRDDSAFVTDLYRTFFSRVPDGGGLAFWTGQISAGMPRGVVLADFMFSPEFVAFTQAIFGDAAVRTEIDVVGDFYRGLLARLPDTTGLDFWVARFRAAQCQGPAAVAAAAESISSLFATSGEYAARARTDSQYVGDLYNAFLRRGGDLTGVQFWVQQLASGAITRELVRQYFVASPEFSGRIAAVVAAGCRA